MVSRSNIEMKESRKTTQIELTEVEVCSLLYLLLRNSPEPSMTEFELIHKFVAGLKDLEVS
jgi:hypothetical protein